MKLDILDKINKVLNENKFSEGDKVTFQNKEWEVLEINNKLLKLVDKEGTEITDIESSKVKTEIETEIRYLQDELDSLPSDKDEREGIISDIIKDAENKLYDETLSLTDDERVELNNIIDRANENF